MVIRTSPTTAVVYCDYCTYTSPARVLQGSSVRGEHICDWCMADGVVS